MGSRAIENRVRKLKELEAQRKAIVDQIEAIQDEIKKDMEAQGTDEIHTPNFVIRFKDVISRRFDSKLFKADHVSLYEAYTRPTVCRRFTVA